MRRSVLRPDLSCVALLCVLALAAAWAAAPPAVGRADDGKAALQLASSEAVFIASLNIERMRGAPLYGALWGALSADPAAADALRQLSDGAGFDAARDLSTLLLLTPADVEASQNYLLIAQGRFDRDRFLAFAQSKGAAYQERVHEGVTFYEVGPLAALGFIDSFLVMGTPASLRGAVDVLRGRAPRLTDSAAAAFIGRADVTQDAWFAFTLPAPLRADLAAASGLPAVGEVVAVTGSIDLQRGLQAKVTLHATTPAAAATLATFLNALLKALADRPALKDSGLSAALGRGQATATAEDVSLVLALTEEEAARLPALLSAWGGDDDQP